MLETSIDQAFIIATAQIDVEPIASNRSRYVNTAEIDGYFPVCGIYNRGDSDPACVVSGINYTPGTHPYVRIINTTSYTQNIDGSVSFIFIKESLLGYSLP